MLFFPWNALAYRALFWRFCHIFHCVFTTKIPKKLIIPQNATIIQGTLLTFLTKKEILPQNAPAYGARFWLFCPIIHCFFTPKTPKKFIFSQIVPIIQGFFLIFLLNKVIFSAKCAIISSNILTLYPTNPGFFFKKKNPKMIIFLKFRI